MPKSPRAGSPPPEDSPVPLGSRQSSNSSLTEKMGRMRFRSSSVPASPRGGSSSKDKADKVQEEPNLSVVMYILTMNGKTFVPKNGGTMCYNPTNDKHVELIEKKKELIHKKCERLGVSYEVVTLNANIKEPLQRIGGISRGYCRDTFPPSKKYE
jgi:hypothetical protein